MAKKTSFLQVRLIETMPVQVARTRDGGAAKIRKEVALLAYEVYAHIFGEQEAMITGDCRGGFGIGELVAFLYARSFPKEEWSDRVADAYRGMNL